MEVFAKGGEMDGCLSTGISMFFKEKLGNKWFSEFTYSLCKAKKPEASCSSLT